MTSVVLQVGSYPPPHGGQAVHIKQLSEYLRQHGMTAATINTGANKQLHGPYVRSVSSSAELLRALVFGHKPSLVHVHTSNPDEFGKLIPVWIASVVKGFKCVLTIHSGNVQTMLEKVRGPRKWLTRLILRGMDCIICVNETTADTLAPWAPRHKFKVIPAFSLDVANARPDERIEAHFRAHAITISCAGFFRELYGLDLAIRAVTRLRSSYPNIGLVIMGDLSGSAPYADLISQEGLNDRVLLCGNVDHDACLAIIRQSAVFMRPTYYDGDSISVREALALGTPVVASDTEFRPTGVTLFKKGNLDDLVEKLGRVLERRSQSPAANGQTHPTPGDSSNLDAIKAIYDELIA